MKKYIDGINSLMRGYQFFGNADLVRGLERAGDLPGDHAGGAVMRRKILILNQIKSNEGRFPIIRKLGKSHIDAFLANMKKKIFSEFDQNTFADVTIDSLIKFMKDSASRGEKITDESYIDWFIDEMALVEDFVEVDEAILKELAPEDYESVIRYLESDIVIDNLSSDEIATIALHALTVNIMHIDEMQLKSLMQYMYIQAEDAAPIDFMVTFIVDRIGKNYDTEYLPMLLKNENFQFASAADARKYIESLSDDIAGITSGSDSGLESVESPSDPNTDDDSAAEDKENALVEEEIKTVKRSNPFEGGEDDSVPSAKRPCKDSDHINIKSSDAGQEIINVVTVADAEDHPALCVGEDGLVDLLPWDTVI